MANSWAIIDFPVPLLVKSSLGLAAILLLVAGGILVIRRARNQPGDEIITSIEILTQFREMHANGRLSDEEFQSIKSQLIPKVHQEMNQDDKPG